MAGLSATIHITVRGFVDYLRANPQVAVLLVVCVVLGFGTFIVVVISLATSGAGTPSGDTSGWLSPETLHRAGRLVAHVHEILQA